MDRNIQNAYSRQASVEVERQVGENGTISVGYQYVRGLNLIISGEPERADVRGGRHQQRLPPRFELRQQQSVLVRGRVELSRHARSFVQRPAAWGHYRISYTLSKSMNNVGETFFSSPIDPFDLSKDWGRSDDDQRHRLVVNGACELPYGST